VSIHTAYYLLLAESYRRGDLSQVYPLARGSAPLIVAAGAYLLVDEPLGRAGLVGVGLVCAGIISLASRGPALPLALSVGALIGCYSLVDGIGVREAGSAFAFIVWLEVLCGIPMTCVVLYRRWGRIAEYARTRGLHPAVGGLVSTIAYASVLYAYSRAPLAEVSALRETSVVFAAAIGAGLLGEPLGTRRILAAATVALGAAILQIS
jgi:drug/metabolite transporter (DMT)-like permease